MRGTGSFMKVKAKASPLDKRAEKLLKTPPQAIKRLGRKVFLKVPLYKAKRQYKAVYVNLPLFKKLFSVTGNVTFAQARATIERVFNTTIEKERGTGERVGDAYADKQFDPLGLSLSGNLGSGRAYYVGKCFNIKGEKTPLATSDQRRFSDGLLEMERAIWETTVANALQGAISTGLNSVLAILDMDEDCEVIWRDKPVHRAKIIRVDEGGELDRITHLFLAKKPLRKKALLDCAKAYGTLEADKFAERILHGSWSPGNISLKGHLIDFDTVCAVRGRSPQYSFTKWHFQNHFGFEIHGQLEILKAVAADRKINVDKVQFDDLKAAALAALEDRTVRRFFGLMGFPDNDKTFKTYRAELTELAALWAELSRKTFRQPQLFSVKEAPSITVHVFDLSTFMRVYPIQKHRQQFTPAEGISLLRRNPYLKPARDKRYKLAVQIEYLNKLHGVIGEHFVASETDYQMLQIAALRFVKRYDALFEKIAAETKADLGDVEARAYVVNEDRFYLFPVYTPTYSIAQNNPPYPPDMMQELVEATIAANRRAGGESGPARIADICLYREGYSYNVLDGRGGFQPGFHFFSGRDLAPFTGIAKKTSKFSVAARQGKTGLLGKKTDNIDLLQHLNEKHDLSLHIIQKTGKKMALSNMLI